jgi:nucleoside-diphosphate-sugar epimerase
MSVRGEASVHARFAQDTSITVYGGNQTRDFVHVDVVCAAILKAIADESVCGTFNIGSGVETPIMQIANEFSEQRGVPVERLPARSGEVDYISLDITRAQHAGLL